MRAELNIYLAKGDVSKAADVLKDSSPLKVFELEVTEKGDGVGNIS